MHITCRVLENLEHDQRHYAPGDTVALPPDAAERLRDRSVVEFASVDREGEPPADLMTAIATLDPQDPAHWNKDGRPDANVLSELTGRRVIGEERDAAWEAFKAKE